MGRKERPKPRSERLEALLLAGDYAGVRRTAKAILDDLAATEDERAGAVRALKRIRPDPGAVYAAIVALLLALGVAAFALIRNLRGAL